MIEHFLQKKHIADFGYKEYSFTEEYNKLLDEFSKLDFDIYYITLYLKDTSIFESRLKRDGKAVPEYARFDISKSINQQNTYLDMTLEIEEKYKNIHVARINTDKDFEEVKKDVLTSISF